MRSPNMLLLPLAVGFTTETFLSNEMRLVYQEFQWGKASESWERELGMAKPLREMTFREHVKRRERGARASKQCLRKVVWAILSATCWQILKENKRIRSVGVWLKEWLWQFSLVGCSLLQGQAPLWWVWSLYWVGSFVCFSTVYG